MSGISSRVEVALSIRCQVGRACRSADEEDTPPPEVSGQADDRSLWHPFRGDSNETAGRPHLINPFNQEGAAATARPEPRE